MADFRDLMASFPTGVAIVTANGEDGTPWGMTCSSVSGVTLTPPTLLVCVRIGSPTLRAVLNAGEFALNLLHDNAQGTAELFASGAPDRFDKVTWEAAAGGPHLVKDAHTVAGCRVSETLLIGDHVVVFGRVDEVTRLEEPVPLLHGLRRYVSWPV